MVDSPNYEKLKVFLQYVEVIDVIAGGDQEGFWVWLPEGALLL